ncbi:MAG: ferritin-like domain-containing protein [Terrimicrobiaceae bacterium]|nr:ferritin-like domain-containing protein [Terrimicrobiaceae bacterium]
MKLNSLHDALVHELQDLYSAEKQLVQALPKMAKAATNEELSAAFEEHLEETKGQIERLDQVFEDLEATSRGHKCRAMEGLIEEGSEILKEEAAPEILDALLIGIAQKIEHYEIAGYGTARTFAQVLGLREVADTLQETLDEEAATDERLTEIAENSVNEEADETEEEE